MKRLAVIQYLASTVSEYLILLTIKELQIIGLLTTSCHICVDMILGQMSSASEPKLFFFFPLQRKSFYVTRAIV